MDIYQIIAEVASAAYDSGDYQAVADALNTPRHEMKDDTRRNTNWITSTFKDPVEGQPGFTEADVVLASMQNSTIPRVKAAYQTMTSGKDGEGISLADPQTIQFIEYLSAADSWPVGLADRIKVYGVWQESDADQLNGGKPFTAQDIVVLAASAKSNADFKTAKAKHNAAIAWLETTDVSGMTVEEVQAWADSILASEDGNPPE